MVGGETTQLLLFQVVHLDDHAIYLVGKVVATGFPVVDEVHHFLNAFAAFLLLYRHFETEFSQPFDVVKMFLQRTQLVLSPLASTANPMA